MSKVLIAVTSHGSLGETGRETGYYLPEVSHPFFALLQQGLTIDQIDIVSPKGGRAPMDPNSYKLDDPLNRQFVERPELFTKVENTLHPSEIVASDYRAILFAGGHGTMWDFPEAADLLAIARAIYEQQNGVVAAVCHGPAALVNLRLSNGEYLVQGRRVAAFTNEEEAAVGLANVVPFLLESLLIERGAQHQKAPLWQQNVVVDERLITGQNPASAAGVGQALAQFLTQ